MKKIARCFSSLMVLALLLGIDQVAALTVEEKWEQITSTYDDYNYDDGVYSQIATYDDHSLTLTKTGPEHDSQVCTFRFDNGLISYDMDGFDCSAEVSDLIYEVKNILGYDYHFHFWFSDRYRELNLEDDGFEVTGQQFNYDTDLPCEGGSGIGTSSMFEGMYCNEKTGMIAFDYFVVEHMTLDLGRGFVTYDPNYEPGTGTIEEETKREESVKVPDTLQNNSLLVMTIAGLSLLVGVGVIYHEFNPSKQK